MSNKLCKECAFWRDEYCSMRREIISSNVRVLNCEMFELKTIPTLFERITASEEVLALELVTLDCDGWWAYVGFGKRKSYPTREEAIAATVKELKEVCDA